MAIYDFKCDRDGGCGHEELNMVMSFAEYDEFKAVSCPCPECGKGMRQIPSVVRFSFPSEVTESGIRPTSKRGQMREMTRRYNKRNQRLEAMHPFWKARMEKFFERMQIRKTPPAELPSGPKTKPSDDSDEG